MITAIYTRENQWNKGEFLKEEQEFENIGQLEHFLAYNRSYITNLTFEGSINENYSCGACGEICEETDGTVSMNSGLLEFTHKAELCSAQDEVYDYEGTISFTTNQKLTQEQLNQLMDIISLQIIEPVDADQNDEDYSSRNVEVTVKEVE
jgi:hypothetical protein